MIFKSLKVVLISLALSVSAQVVAEKMPESPKQKEVRIETALNKMFQESLKAAMAEMNEDHSVAPFAFILRSTGRVGYFTATDENLKTMSVMAQSQGIRRILKDMAGTDQIDATVQVMYASVSSGDVSRQGLIFEVEHREGISFSRFLPVEKMKDENGKETGKLLFDTKQLATSNKPRSIFVK